MYKKVVDLNSGTDLKAQLLLQVLSLYDFCSLQLKPDNDKAHRTLVHAAIKREFSKLDTSAVNGCVNVGNLYVVDVKVFFAKGGNARQKRGKAWPKDLDEYTSFVLYKENKDTSEAIFVLAKLLG